jgi:hypothetical protein
MIEASAILKMELVTVTLDSMETTANLKIALTTVQVMENVIEIMVHVFAKKAGPEKTALLNPALKTARIMDFVLMATVSVLPDYKEKIALKKAALLIAMPMELAKMELASVT